MTRVLQVPLDVILEDSAPPNEGGRIIHDHALLFFQRVAPMFPAVMVRIDDGTVRLVRGSDYLKLARSLEMKSIRGIVVDSTADAIECAKRAHGLIELDTSELDAPVPQESWHFFVFDGPLTPAEREVFHDAVLDLFNGATSSEGLRNNGHALEFYAPSPLDNTEWVGEFMSRCKEYSESTKQIVSYQGRRPPWQPGSGGLVERYQLR